MHLEFHTRNVPEEMRTSWKLFDVTKFQEEIKAAQKPAVTTQVQKKAQMAQTMTRNKVRNISKPGLEQTAAQSPDAMMQTSSRQQRKSPGKMLQISSRQKADEIGRKRKRP